MKIATVTMRCGDKQYEFGFVLDENTQESLHVGMKILLKKVLRVV